ncbi:hypothetical protein BGZ57DRAFT_932890 [Hyaloscypha finlandica]|nr:hypothetical protein BGZ57DRAFT_932890 [Hyaloscypha finlandica]
MADYTLQEDYRSRFKDFQAVEIRREALEVLETLDIVKAQLGNVTKERAREVAVLEADLESERDARRGWQDKATTLRERLSSLEQARFVLVLVDADADIYLFQEKYLSRDDFMTKVREYLVSLGPAMKDAKTIPVIVKAYANLSGLAQACVRDKKVGSAGDMGQFWCGFTRRYPLVDFVDVGAGKEEADNKLREVLAFHIVNPQCEHILLACCHDAGYVPVLRQYAAQATLFERMTLLSAGVVRPDIGDLGFRTTRIFDSLFGGSPRVTLTATNGKNVQMPPVTV